ncbi:regulator [Mycobacterium sp. 1554424.7]|nr:regulator [Mycobacterium sp. 1554424.7]
MPVAVPGAKPRAILTMLGLHSGAVVSADTLVELLWGEDPPRTAAKALQTHISSLRRALGDGFVLTAGGGWTLAESDVDASRYKSAARLGRDAATAGDTSGAVARFEEALALWRGVPELPDGRRGTSEKTRWVEGHAALVEDRLDALLATGRAAEVIGDLEAAVADAPLRERRWGQLMLALYRAGRQGEALSAYQRARSLLVDELGVDPGPELRRLEAAIVAQDASLDIPVAQNLPAMTRAVTFLLTDIEGSTAAWEADAAAMGIALARHDELVEQVVTSRGGRLIKTRGEGDATFSVFERPSAAAAAAIELQDAIVHEPWALAEPMRIRVALHTGEAELRDGDYFGRAVNRAARLRSLAEGGQILCSGATAELVIDSLSDDALLIDLGMRQLKNLARPEHVFELRLEAAEDHRQEVLPEAPLVRPSLPAVLVGPGPFVGRGHELGQLFSAWQTTLAGGTNAALIAGEPGVGKTRLAGEWSRQAYDQGALVIYGRCDEDLGAPYQPFAEALRSLVPCLDSKGLRGLRGVEALLALVPGLTDALPDLAAPTRADPDTERYALFDAVVALLGFASARAPVVLILDDLHWAAKPTLLLLRHLLRFGEQARVQIVGTYRSTDLDRSHPLAAMLADLHRDGTGDRIQLSGLDEKDVTTYVAEAGYDDEELARALASVTGGNPFFLIEALRHVDESGGHWDPRTLPQGVREAVSRRLSRLPADTNKALAAAAVVGSRFALELVERVVDQDLVDAFEEATKAGIIIEEHGGHYRFNHALVRQSLLAELASVRRMRLHQRIAATLENEPGADDELLAELAYHYFECAWAGNADKAVDYCRRAADQAMARLGYEAAADLYDRALHALEEIDEELPDRADQVAELLVARCEALLAAGDVTTAAGAVSQLQSATADSARLAAWATCFDGELSMLVNPERLDEIEVALSAAAAKLAELSDAAGEAKAHTVRATCLARLGRVGDCEVALDDALTAARRAGEHRRVNAVLAGAPLAALWGPNPVPRAGGRCLDVVRLLRITTDSPAVEATSTRCQAVLEAFRGRAEAARRMIDSARRTVTELGLRHALLEVEQFAGIVELVVDDPAAAEPHLRQAHNGFRRMGLDADTAETAALLGRTCLALGREAEADELCTESERLAGHALKPAIAWRTLRARLLSRRGDHDEARRIAEAAVALAERTDALVDHGDACLSLATVLASAGDVDESRAAAERAVDLYERKGAAALAERARGILGEREQPPVQAPLEAPGAELDNACVRAIRQLDAAIDREAWDETERRLAPEIFLESRRSIVGFPGGLVSPNHWVRDVVISTRELGGVWHGHAIVAVRGDRLALTRLEVHTADVSPGAPRDDSLQLFGLDNDGRIALHVWFDTDDMDAALAELDAAHARFKEEQPRHDTGQLDNACVRVSQRIIAAIHNEAWDAFEELYAPDGLVESRRKILGFPPIRPADWARKTRRAAEASVIRLNQLVIGVRGARLALVRLAVGSADVSPGAPQDEFLSLGGIDDQGRVALQVWFDVDDMDAAIAELDALQAKFADEHPPARWLENGATRVYGRMWKYFEERDWVAITDLIADDELIDDRRRVVNGGVRHGRDAGIEEMRAAAEIGFAISMVDVKATRGGRLALTRVRAAGRDPAAVQNDVLQVIKTDADERIAAVITFDIDDFDSAITELDARYLAGEAADHARTWSVIAGAYVAHNRRELPATTPDVVTIDHRRVAAFAPGEGIEYTRAGWDLDQTLNIYVETVHRINDLGAVFTWTGRGTSREGFDAEWRGVNLFTVDGEMLSRAEAFDDEDLDTALAKFDQLTRPAPPLENTASRVDTRFQACFAARDWDAMAEMLSDGFSIEDRRRVVNMGNLQGRDAELGVHSYAVVGSENVTSTVIATRAQRLALSHYRFSGPDQRPDAFRIEMLALVEIDADDRMAAVIVFDADDVNAAIAELDARYLAGDAADHAHTWSVITAAYDAINRHEFAELAPDWVNIDHRRGASFAPGDMIAYLKEMFDDAPDTKVYIEVVHRLNNFGAVVTEAAHGTSQQGFQAEWREIAVAIFDGDLLSRYEMFDEADLDAALRRFDELSRPTPRLENAASQAAERFRRCFAARDWDGVAEVFAEDILADDRRRVVGIGVRRGRQANVADVRTGADLGTEDITSTPIATRGDRIFLDRARFSGNDPQPDAPSMELLRIVEVDAENRYTRCLMFDVDDFEAAFAELDARYIAGEAAAHSDVWSAIAGSYAALNRREPPLTAPDCDNVDHRRETAFGPGDLTAYIHTGLDLDPGIDIYVEQVHRLSDIGAIVTYAAHETSQEGFQAEWRGIAVFAVKDGMINRTEVFDESHIEAAIARFEELSRPAPRLENAASQVYQRFLSFFPTRDWDAIAEILANDVSSEDRRRVVGSDVRVGRDAVIAELSALASTGAQNQTLVAEVEATRGQRLILTRSRYTASDERGAYYVDGLEIVEIDADERLLARVGFDLDDFDAAIAELDARYLAGEGAAHAHTWSVITRAYAALNRRELPPTKPGWVNIDHRRAIAFAPGEMTAYVRAGMELAPDTRIYIETVHRLNSVGAVITQVLTGTSQDGFDAEWREIGILIFEGGLISCSELFDDTDLDPALGRFDELSQPPRRLENAATRVQEHIWGHFAARDWDALADLLIADVVTDDRRRVVGSGVQHGRDVQIADLQTLGELYTTDVTLSVIATRGDRLTLNRVRLSGKGQGQEAFLTEVLAVAEIDADERLVAVVSFDIDDIDAAFEELDARYLAGEAAAYAHTWSVIARACLAFNQHEIPATTPDSVAIEHRPLLSTEAVDLAAAIRAVWELTPDVSMRIEAVHRLSELGAVLTYLLSGTSQDGFDAEWRMIEIFTVDGELISGCEVFDEAELDTALARFEELHPQTPRLENAASRVDQRFWACIATSDWDAITERVADDIYIDDRRKTINAGVRHGRDNYIADLRTIAEFSQNTTSTVVATRGTRLALAHIHTANRNLEFAAELLCVVETDADDRMVARIGFDIDDSDGAFEELDARYLEGEAAPHARTWSAITKSYAAVNRRETPPTTPDWVNIDHRRGIAFAPGETIPYLRATWDVAPFHIYIETVHRLTALGAVVTWAAHGTSEEGFDAEWRGLNIVTAEADLVNRLEVFDEADLETALARFDELRTHTRRLENAAAQADSHFFAHIRARNWAAAAEILTDNSLVEDRRRVVNIGVWQGRDVVIANLRALADALAGVTSTVVALRGERLALTCISAPNSNGHQGDFGVEMMGVAELDDDNRVAAHVLFDPDDIDAAFEELDARYLAGEAAAHARTWSLVTSLYATVNRHELPAMTTDSVVIDHRSLISIEAVDTAAFVGAVWKLTPELSMYVEAAHRLNNLGAVVTLAVRGTSEEAFDVEWRLVGIVMFEGDRLTRSEVFDEADLDAALARFDELQPQPQRVENTASQVAQRFLARYVARDWDVVTEMLVDDMFNDDRRHVVNAGLRRGRDATIASMRTTADLGLSAITSTVIATRGERLVLSRERFSLRRPGPEDIIGEILGIFEIDADKRIVARIALDLDDFDAAIAELDARYLAGEAAAHADVWSVMAENYVRANRREFPATTPDHVYTDHRALVSIEGADLAASLRALWDITSASSFYAEAVHRLDELGAVVTHVVEATTPEGLDVEERMIGMAIVEGQLFSRVEYFDEADLDAAVARFEELHPQAPPLENAASQAVEREWACFANRDWAAMAETMTDDFSTTDHRRVVNAGVLRGRDAHVANYRAVAEVGFDGIASTTIATRGQRLALIRVWSSARGFEPGETSTAMIGIVEVDADNRLTAAELYDLEEIDAAFEQLETRYLAGEAAPCARTWSAMARTCAVFNQGELPATTPDSVFVDYRPVLAVDAIELPSYLRAMWDVTPDIRVEIEAVHRLSELGAVVTHVVNSTSPDGFNAEWRGILIYTFEAEMVNRCEVFDEADLDAALARFKELHREAG